MPRYQYTYINSSGKKDEATIEAMSKDIAVLRLRKMGFYVTSIQREESQIQQTQKQTSPEPERNFATWTKENNPIRHRSNFAPQSEKNSDAESKTSTVVKQKRFEAVEQHRIKMIDCPACNCRISSLAGACPHCGQPIRPIQQSSNNNKKTITCSGCKNIFPAETKWCPECGRRLSAPIPWFVWVLMVGLFLKLIGSLMKAGVI